MISIQDLLAPQSATAIRASMVTMLKTLGIPADQWRPGGALSLMLTVVATVFAGFTVLMAQAIGSGFLPTASGGWLTLLAYYVYGVTRPAATFANGQLTLTNSGGGSWSYPPGQALFADSTNGQQYTNAETISLGPNSTQTLEITCTQAGKIGSAPPGEITTVVTQMQGVTCTNVAAVVGQDSMSDPNLRSLCINKLGAMSVRGPRNAYAYAIQVALNAVTGAPVDVNRQTITRSSHTGTVGILVASPSGAPDPNDVAGIVSSIETGVPGMTPPFSGVRPDCVTVTVSGAAPVLYGPALTVYAIAPVGTLATSVSDDIATGLSSYMSVFPIGGVLTNQGQGLWASGIEAQVQQAVANDNGVTIVSVEGATNLALTAGQVATDGISVTVILVAA